MIIGHVQRSANGVNLVYAGVRLARLPRANRFLSNANGFRKIRLRQTTVDANGFHRHAIQLCSSSQNAFSVIHSIILFIPRVKPQSVKILLFC